MPYQNNDREKMALPNGWKLFTVGQLYDVIGGGTPSTGVKEYWDGDIPWITSADIFGLKDIRPRRYITPLGIQNSATNLVPGGSIIVVTRVALGKVAQTGEQICFSQDSQGLISKYNDLLPDYVLYFLSQAVQVFKYMGRGTTISGVTKKQLKELYIPLPPLPEQERIVARVEELFTQLDAGVASLRRVKTALKRYKASVLKAACEGRLVNGDKDLAEGELPEGWRWVTLEKISSGANYGTSQKCNYDKNDFPVIRIPNISLGNIELTDLKYAVNSTGLREKDSLSPGDLLIIRTNGSKELIGRSVLIKKPMEKPHYFASYLIRYKIKDFEIIGDWIASIWDSPIIRTWLEGVIATTAGQYNLNIAKLNNLPIPFPPPAEQRRLVAEIEQRLSVADQVEAAADAGLKRAGRLRQAILKRAFEGRLV